MSRSPKRTGTTVSLRPAGQTLVAGSQVAACVSFSCTSRHEPQARLFAAINAQNGPSFSLP